MRLILVMALTLALIGCSSKKINFGSESNDSSNQRVENSGDAEIDSSHVDFNSARTDLEIIESLNRLKSPLVSLYNRALREDPFIEGVIVFQFKIDVDGKTKECEIAESNLNSLKLKKSLLEQFCSFNFGEKRADLIHEKILEAPYKFIAH